jgi:hypothetical protein
MDIEAYGWTTLFGRCGLTHEDEQGVRVKERYNSKSYTELRCIVLKRSGV